MQNKMLKESNHQLRILYPENMSFRNEEKSKTSQMKKILDIYLLADMISSNC